MLNTYYFSLGLQMYTSDIHTVFNFTLLQNFVKAFTECYIVLILSTLDKLFKLKLARILTALALHSVTGLVLSICRCVLPIMVARC